MELALGERLRFGLAMGYGDGPYLGLHGLLAFVGSAHALQRVYGVGQMPRCNAEGRVTFANGRRACWWIGLERRGRVILTDGQPIHLPCAACTSRQFEPVYNPDRDG